MQLRDEGQLHLDDPAVEHLPELRAAASPFGRSRPSRSAGCSRTSRACRPIRPGPTGPSRATRASASATSSAPRRSPRRPAEHAAEVLEPRLPAARGDRGPRERHPVPGVRAGADPRAARDDGHSRFDPLPEALAPSGARPGTPPGSSRTSSSLASIPPPSRAEGGLWSSVEDLARWLSFQLREDGGARDGAQILAGDDAEGDAQAPLPRRRRVDRGLRHLVVRDPQGRGDLGAALRRLYGFITSVCFDPKEKVGAIALLNGIGDAAELAMELGAIARDAVREAAPADRAAGGDARPPTAICSGSTSTRSRR